jgi:hypothetical protein
MATNNTKELFDYKKTLANGQQQPDKKVF